MIATAMRGADAGDEAAVDDGAEAEERFLDFAISLNIPRPWPVQK
jgi:hypothetical protein